MRAFLVLFLLFPVLELYTFFKVSTAIGFFPALLMIIIGSVLGVMVMRLAGLATVLRTREALQRGEVPADQVFDGLMFAIGGGLLLLPGFISDVLGVICLMPFTRNILARKIRARAQAQSMRQRAFADDLQPRGPAAGPGTPPRRPPEVIEGEVIEGDFERRDH